MSDSALTASLSISPPSPFSNFRSASATPSRGPLGPFVTGLPPTFLVSICPAARAVPATCLPAQLLSRTPRNATITQNARPPRAITHPFRSLPGTLLATRSRRADNGSAQPAGFDALHGAGAEH